MTQDLTQGPTGSRYDAARGAETPPITVPVVVGTRPEAIKLVPIILALRRCRSFRPVVVATGQHHRMVSEIFALAGITTDAQLWVGDVHAPLSERVASVMTRFDDFCRERFGAEGVEVATANAILDGFPGAVIVHGDTSSAMAAALAAFHLRIPVLHVEAGLRAGRGHLTPFPEELNRQVISRIASLHFAPTPDNLENLVRENVRVSRVFVTGNTGIDALRWASQLPARFDDEALQALVDGDRRLVVVTAHRRENWGEGLAGIAEGVRRIGARPSGRELRRAAAPQPAGARGPDGIAARELRTSCSPSHCRTRSSPACSAAAIRSSPTRAASRRRRPRWARRCSSPARPPNGSRASRPAPCCWSEATRRRSPSRRSRLLDRPARLRADGARAEPLWRRTRGGAHRGRAGAHRARTARRPTPFGPGYDRLAVIRAAGYDVGAIAEARASMCPGPGRGGVRRACPRDDPSVRGPPPRLA